MAVCNKIILFLFLFNKLFDNAEYCLITQDNKLKKKNCICDEYVINLFVCIYEVRKGT